MDLAPRAVPISWVSSNLTCRNVAGRCTGQACAIATNPVDDVDTGGRTFIPTTVASPPPGARPNPRWLQPLLNQGHPVYCGFDADPTGDDMARAMTALHPTVKRLRPPEHDWNDVLRAHA